MSLLSLQSLDGKPIAVMGNLGFHFISPHHGYLSSDAAGYFGTALARELGADPAFIGLLSQGPCGDTSPGTGFRSQSPRTYAEDVAKLAAAAYRDIEHHDWVPIDIAERAVVLPRRTPSPERLGVEQESTPGCRQRGNIHRVR